MVENIQAALDKLAKIEDPTDEDEESLQELSQHICAFGFGMGFSYENIIEETQKELGRVAHYWLDEEYPSMVKAGIVPALETAMVGYNKGNITEYIDVPQPLTLEALSIEWTNWSNKFDEGRGKNDLRFGQYIHNKYNK